MALVIGEGGYRSAPELANPPNDARDVAEALKALGFAVTLGVDLDQARMERTIGDFALSATTADVSLFYYGGHGLQIAGHNYLRRSTPSFAASTTSTDTRFLSTAFSPPWRRAAASIWSSSTPAATIRSRT